MAPLNPPGLEEVAVISGSAKHAANRSVRLMVYKEKHKLMHQSDTYDERAEFCSMFLFNSWIMAKFMMEFINVST